MPTILEAALASRPKLRKTRALRTAVNLSSPVTLERRYASIIRRIMDATRQAVRELLIPELEDLVEQNRALNPRDRQDQSIAERIRQLVEATRSRAGEQFSDAEIEAMATEMAGQVNEKNRAAVSRAFKAALGVEIFANEPFVQTTMENFAAENVALIRSTNEEFLRQTQRTVFEGLRRGERHEVIAQSILGTSKDYLNRTTRWTTAENRAKLIARDQINKLNGQLTQLRQENAGINKYIWRTVGDDRVRPEHADLEGKEFSWDSPPSIGHPGEPINCRCYAEPIFEV